MKMDCEVVRDLLPLYADDVCSGKSRALIEEHIRECEDCQKLLGKLRQSELEEELHKEKNTVLRYGALRFRRRSAAVGGTVAALFMIPVLVCLCVNLASGHGLDWFFIVLAALAVTASLTVVPLMVAEDRMFWTFCAFCVSLLVLLGVVCLYTGGSWYWIASSSTLFGLSAVFLPFVVRARPLRSLLGCCRRWLVVLAVDGALFVNMMNMITSRGALTGSSIVLTVCALAGLGIAALEIMRKRGTEQ